jgi:uncharacterized protein YjiK
MAALTSVDLSTYTLVGRYDLPEPTRTKAPVNSLLAQEVSAVTYNWDNDSLYVVGDGGTSIVQVSKTGQLLSSMTLPPGNSAQGTEFFDPEGLAYIGGGKFVMTEERDRQLVQFTYVAGGTLARAAAQTVKLGTTIGNIGFEGVSYDPLSGGFIVVKEKDPEGIFQTTVNFNTGLASNGSPTTVNSINLFDPSKLNLLDFADIFSLSNVSTLTGADASHLLVLSQESGKILNIDRNGTVFSSLTITAAPTDKLSVVDQQHEGVTLDNNGFLYVTSENGGGDIDHPQLWVYAPTATSTANQAPTAVLFANALTALPANTNTATAVKVADIAITDDGKGNNNLSLSGADASFFEITNGALFLKAGTVINAATKASYNVTVNVDDPTIGTTPDASKAFTLNVGGGTSSALIVSEASPWSSGNSAYAADWFEVTNTGTTAVNITGWKMDDNSNSFGSAVALRGITTIGAGKSVVFIEGLADGTTDAALAAAFSTAWFGTSTLPTGFQIGYYGGSGVGLSTGGDSINLFDAAGNRITGTDFGPSTTFRTFDNKAGVASTTLPLPTVSSLSTLAINGAFLSANGKEIGSPGAIAASVIVSEVSPWSSGNSPYAADWFEVTNTGFLPVDLTGWKMDDNSNSFGSAVTLRGVSGIAPGQSVIFIEGLADSSTDAAIIAAFSTAWFGQAKPPAGIVIGTYGGAGVGLSTGGDAVNLFDSVGNRVTGINFGVSTTYATFDNTAGLGSATLPLPTVSALSAKTLNGAFQAPNSLEVGSPGSIANSLIPIIRGGIGNDTGYGTSRDDIFWLGDGNNIAYGNGGNDQFTTGSGNDTLFGGSGNDVFDAGDGINVLYGNGGNDKFTTGSGNDTIYGGSGNDVFDAGAGNNVLFGNGGNDTFLTGAGNDTIYGGSGNDTITTDGGNDLIYGNGGNDTIFAGTGDDVIYVGFGTNFIDGGSGNDTIWLNGGKDTVVLGRSNGVDTVNGYQAGRTSFALSGGLRYSDLTFSQGNGFTQIAVGADVMARVSWAPSASVNNSAIFTTI